MAVGKRGDGRPPALMGWDAPLSPELDHEQVDAEQLDDSLFPDQAQRRSVSTSEIALSVAMVLATIAVTSILLFAAGAFGPGAGAEPPASSQRR
jgi:hypothetical protein